MPHKTHEEKHTTSLLANLSLEKKLYHLNAKQVMMQRLANQRAVDFATFMEQALYDTHHGYYQSPFEKIGEHGDFITAAAWTPYFAKTIAQQCLQIFKTSHIHQIIEIGPGNGFMAAHIIKTLHEMGVPSMQYFLYDISSYHQQLQKNMLLQIYPKGLECVEWVKLPLAKPMDAIVIANEVLDALPFRRFLYDQKHFYECFVIHNNHEFAFEYQPIAPGSLLSFLHTLPIAPYDENRPYFFEVNFSINPWLHTLNNSIRQGLILIIDYGYPEQEFYHPERTHGTLKCFFQHHTHDNPLILFGIQDITMHVNFSALAELAHQLDFKIEGFTSQANFLINNGILDFLHKDAHTIDGLTKEIIKQLIMPQHMGELCKVMALSKNIVCSLEGFSQGDIKHKL